MGAYRDALMGRSRNGWWHTPLRYRFGAPATDRQLAEAEAALGCPIPAALRELYAEFIGTWTDGVPELQVPNPKPDVLQAYRVFAVFRSQRIPVGKTPNLTPATSV